MQLLAPGRRCAIGAWTHGGQCCDVLETGNQSGTGSPRPGVRPPPETGRDSDTAAGSLVAWRFRLRRDVPDHAATFQAERCSLHREQWSGFDSCQRLDADSLLCHRLDHRMTASQREIWGGSGANAVPGSRDTPGECDVLGFTA